MTLATAIVPGYGDDPIRRANLRTVDEHLRWADVIPNIIPGFDAVGLGAGLNAPGRARNVGAEAAGSSDVFLFNDGDTICPREQIREAVKRAAVAPGLVFAYDLYVRLGREASARYRADRTDPFRLPAEQTITNSGSMGCVAISRACFTEVGGFDESYVGWGYEDLDFARRCAELWPTRRVAGPVFHLWHGERRADDSPADSEPAQVESNHRRWTRVASGATA